MQVFLLFLAAVATGLVIGDAVLMPAFSGAHGCMGDDLTQASHFDGGSHALSRPDSTL